MSMPMPPGPPPIQQPAKRSIWNKKLGGADGLFGWNRLAFANSATRREAKALLFQELAEAVRHDMPLDEALSLAMRSDGETGSKPVKPEGDALSSVTMMLYILFLSVGGIILLMLISAWASDVERVARVLAHRLLPLIRAGHPLSDAMAKLRTDYTPQEVASVRAGEQQNNLPMALEKLGQFQYYERDLQRQWNRMGYPVWIGTFMLAIVGFCMVFIMPKYRDIYDQLALELPGPTQLLVGLGYALNGPQSPLPLVLGIGILVLVLRLLIVRMFMVGSGFLRNIMLIPAGAAAGFLVFEIAQLLSELGTGVLLLSLIPLIIVLLGYAILWLRFHEWLILWMERLAGGVFGRLPIVGAPRQTEREARWLGALSAGLTSGVEAADALETAGGVCGGLMQRRSQRAAQLVRAGHTVGDAVVEAGVLRRPYAHRVRLLDFRPHYLHGLEAIAEDAGRDSFHALNRASRLAEAAVLCLIGLFVAFFAIAMYLPLFNIPRVIGANY